MYRALYTRNLIQSSQNSDKVSAETIPVLQMRKWRLRELNLAKVLGNDRARSPHL